jgi:hypothetical protein
VREYWEYALGPRPELARRLLPQELEYSRLVDKTNATDRISGHDVDIYEPLVRSFLE